ncbi:hypothetical protein FZEAL_1856 [Fusarium zealandicum]|uniref:Uncharacterized protein n=1 Tax=Fusarium zealandicum TaxID=1053134 RepID=A0A8H4XPH8_9HYPO|nr:hypothetical protein FZEAL_1856 [Fusarium zealandicum]
MSWVPQKQGEESATISTEGPRLSRTEAAAKTESNESAAGNGPKGSRSAGDGRVLANMMDGWINCLTWGTDDGQKTARREHSDLEIGSQDKITQMMVCEKDEDDGGGTRKTMRGTDHGRESGS